MFYKLYRILSPKIKYLFKSRGLASGSCRFYPTCSSYAKQAISIHGIFLGSFLATKRMLKCHPLNPGGYDPVPLKNKLFTKKV